MVNGQPQELTPARPEQDRGNWQKAGRRWSVFLRHCWLAAIAVFTLSLVFVTLAAYQFQDSIKKSFAEADKARTFTNEMKEVYGKYRRLDQEIAFRLKAFQAAEDKLSAKMRPALYDQVLQERAKSKLKWLQSPYVPAVDRGGGAQASTALAASDGEGLEAAVAAYKEYLRHLALISTLGPDREQAPVAFELYQHMLAFSSLRPATFYLFEPMSLAVMPSFVLTLIVTLAMGALGSVLYLAKWLLKHQLEDHAATPDRPMSWFIMRPLLGMATALVIFVFLQTGLALTEGALTGPSDTINPFLIAFLAIVSGLLSWQAIERIERWGTRLFGTEAIQRWAYGLKGTFAVRSDKTVDDLAAFLNESKEKIQRWMEEREPVPADVQDKITAWFNIDRRHLFSDQPPR